MSAMYSIKEVSKILDLHPKTVLRFIREDKIKASKIGREWRIQKEDLRQYAHGELAGGSEEKRSSVSIRDRIHVSAVLEVDEGHSEEVSRISNGLLAVLNSKDPSWGSARYDLIYHPETRKARFLLFGTVAFIKTILELIEVLVQQEDEA